MTRLFNGNGKKVSDYVDHILQTNQRHREEGITEH